VRQIGGKSLGEGNIFAIEVRQPRKIEIWDQNIFLRKEGPDASMGGKWVFKEKVAKRVRGRADLRCLRRKFKEA